MPKATVTSKGQITVPKAVREHMGLRAGDELEFVEQDGYYVLRKKVLKNPFEKWRGYLKHLGKTTDELMIEMRGEPYKEEE